MGGCGGDGEFQVEETVDWRGHRGDTLEYVAHLAEYTEEEDENQQGDITGGTITDLDRENTRRVILFKGEVEDAVVYGPYPDGASFE